MPEFSPITFEQTTLNVWEERDRLHIQLIARRGERTLAEWWDDDARAMFEDGFFTHKGGLHQSVFAYWRQMADERAARRKQKGRGR